MTKLGAALLLAVGAHAATAAAAADPRNRAEASLQGGAVLENPAFGPELGYGRRLLSWRRLDVFAGASQVYRLTPALDDPHEFGTGTSRSEWRHHFSLRLGPGAALRLPPGERLLVGLDLLGGFTYLKVHGRFKNPDQGIDRPYAASDTRSVFGVRLWSSFRVSARWSLLVSYWRPLGPALTSGWHAGVGAAVGF